MFMNRRQAIAAGLALPVAWPVALATPANAQTPVYIGDMHFHSFFGAQTIYHSRPLAKTLADGKATLIAWSLGGDLLWIGPTPRGYSQKAVPKPGESLGWFQRELARIKAHVAEQGLKLVKNAADVELALKGEPHVVLAVEGANFIEDDPGRVQLAYDLGLRHLQLVHYSQNTIGDFQTERPQHNGLTEIGRKVLLECNRLGILVDLAHCSSAAVSQALAISKAPMVWSHGSVTRTGTPHWSMVAWKARQLTVAEAKAIAAKGGVVGLWAFTPDVGPSPEAYADRLSQLADWIGEDHVGFGTDINGLGTKAAVSNFVDVQRVVEHWERSGVPQRRIRKLAIENYARVLRLALQPMAG